MPQIRPIGISGSIPSVNQLALGDIAINTYDGKAYIKKAVGNTQTIIEIGTGGGGSSISASYAATASYAFFAVTASFAQNFNPTATASYAVTASYALLANTASYALFSLSSSFAATATTASYVLSSSYALNAGTASYVLNAVSSSYALSSSYASNAGTASYVLNAVSASYALSSSFARTASFAQNAQTASYVLNAVSSSFSSTASYVNPLTQSVFISGSTGIYGNLSVTNATLVDFNTSVLNINAPLLQVPSFGLAYSPSANVRVVMYDAVSNALFVTASAPTTPVVTNLIATGSITASVQIGPAASVPYFFLVQSSSVEMLKINAERVVVLEARIDLPTPVTGGLYYSASGDFFFGM